MGRKRHGHKDSQVVGRDLATDDPRALGCREEMENWTTELGREEEERRG